MLPPSARGFMPALGDCQSKRVGKPGRDERPMAPTRIWWRLLVAEQRGRPTFREHIELAQDLLGIKLAQLLHVQEATFVSGTLLNHAPGASGR